MKPVDQARFDYPNGNCFAACVASILELPIEETPSIEGKRFYTVWGEWLASRGLAMVDIPGGTGCHIAGYCIAAGVSPRASEVDSERPMLHAVVCRDMYLLHDPHPDRKFVVGPIKEYTVIYPIEPWKWNRRDDATN